MRPEEKIQQLARIAESDNSRIVTAWDLREWSEEEINQFEQEEYLLFQGYADTVRCGRCHKGCTVEPTIAHYPDGQQKGVFLCSDENEGGRIEFEMEELRYWEINTKRLPKNEELPLNDEWITFTEAAELLGVRKGTVSKWAKAGRFQDNGLVKQHRRLSKISVLLVKQEIDNENLKQDVKDLRRDSLKLR